MSSRRFYFSCLLLWVPRPALGQEPAPEPAEPTINVTSEPEPPAEPTIQVASEPAPPPVKRTYHVHEGFYARLSFGGGYAISHYNTEDADFDLRGTGFNAGVDLLIGGSPAPGIAIGGAFMANLAFSNTFKANDRDLGNRNLSTFLLGPFVDGYPDPKGGFHLGLALGLGPAKLEAGNGDEGLGTFTGFGAAGWLGYDFWVADEWSAGLLYRFGTNIGVGQDSMNQSLSVVGLTNTFLLTTAWH